MFFIGFSFSDSACLIRWDRTIRWLDKAIKSPWVAICSQDFIEASLWELGLDSLPLLGLSVLRFLANVIWFLFGGVLMGLGWWLAGLVAALTIIGIPWARACFVIGNFSFWPFGKEAISRSELTGKGDLGTGPLGFVGNLIWFLLAGWWLAVGHVTSALACFITIIGIPFGLQHLKLAVIALAPIGLEVVPSRR